MSPVVRMTAVVVSRTRSPFGEMNGEVSVVEMTFGGMVSRMKLSLSAW